MPRWAASASGAQKVSHNKKEPIPTNKYHHPQFQADCDTVPGTVRVVVVAWLPALLVRLHQFRGDEMRTAMLTVFAVACTVAALALAPCAHAHGGAPTATHPAGRVALDPTTRQFVLPDGRHFLMHGLAVDNNAGLPEVTDDTMQTMAAWGFNAVRLGFHWSLYEPVQGEPNSTYLSGIAQVVKRLGEYGIFVVLDMHQDVWAPMYCNAHGFPDWIGSPTNSSEYYKGGSKAFPEPMAKPSYTNDTSQAPWGTVDAATCQAASQAGFGWASSYLTYALGNAVQRLYDNEDGILDLYGRFWATVAREVCMPNANCLGYEVRTCRHLFHDLCESLQVSKPARRRLLLHLTQPESLLVLHVAPCLLCCSRCVRDLRRAGRRTALTRTSRNSCSMSRGWVTCSRTHF